MATAKPERLPNIPEGVKEKPEPEKFKKPVAWLLGRQLVSGLKWVALYAAFKNKLDQRNWMMHKEIEVQAAADKDEYWFDYISDTGDGQKATYSIAYLCLSNLSVSAPKDELPKINDEAFFEHTGDESQIEHGKTLLPRGGFLFVGGDTGYHIADFHTLAMRFQAPFCWAYEDLWKENEKNRTSLDPRPIFAIPGNHDYYDQLDGFNRQFRKPVAVAGHTPQLEIPGFRREQEASFVAIHILPFDWWFWGLDTELDRIDTRQVAFFNTVNEGRAPGKLIVATPEPTTVAGAYSGINEKTATAYKALGLDLPFIEAEKPLDQDKCRLDISGDSHRYERYWGPKAEGRDDSTPQAKNYASVVSGLGGAFHHPSYTKGGRLKNQAIYPPQGRSSDETARKVLNVWNIITGGYVWLMGLIGAGVVHFAATLPESSKSMIDAVLFQGSLNVSKERVIQSTGFFESVTEFIRPMSPEADLSRFGYSLMMLASLALIILAVAGSIIFSKRLNREARKREITDWHYLPIGIALAVAFSVTGFMVWRFGRFPVWNQLSDILFTLVVLASVVGLSLYGALTGAKGRSARAKIGFAALGLWHGILQVGVPLVLIRMGNEWALLYAPALVLLFTFTGMLLAKNDKRGLLLGAWIVYGGLLLSLPVLLSDSTALLARGFAMRIALLLLACLVGAVMSCAFLGWYLITSVAFGGHSDEAGGAARIERFKQFIRFRVRERDITGFVIAFDEPETEGQKLKPKIIDVFQLSARTESN